MYLARGAIEDYCSIVSSIERYKTLSVSAGRLSSDIRACREEGAESETLDELYSSWRHGYTQQWRYAMDALRDTHPERYDQARSMDIIES